MKARSTFSNPATKPLALVALLSADQGRRRAGARQGQGLTAMKINSWAGSTTSALLAKGASIIHGRRGILFSGRACLYMRSASTLSVR